MIQLARLVCVLSVTIATASAAHAQGAGPAGGRGAGGRGPIVPTTRDLGGGLTLVMAGSNAVLAVGSSGAILVDTTFGGPAVAATVAELTGLPLKYVINTHSHPDHTGGTAGEVVAMKLLADDRSPTTPGPDNRDQFIRTLYNAQKTGQGR